jgi:multiple sugar transport system substrate-binding protein
MKKSLIFAAVLLCAVLPGCSKKETASGGGSEKVTIVVGGWPSADVGFKAALAGFNEKYPNINVEIEMAETSAYHQALQTALAAGQGAPDVAMIEGAYIAQYRDSKALVNLLEAPYNADRYKNDFVGLKWNQAYSSDGKRMVAFSWDIGPSTYFYRQDIFKEAGLPTDPDEVAELVGTWGGLLDVAKKVHIPGKRWLLPEAHIVYQEFFHNRDFFDEKLNLLLDRPGDSECLNAVIEMRKSGLDMGVDMWSTEAYAAFDNGALVSVITGAWYGGFLKDDVDPDGTGNWRATYLPGGIRDKSIGGSFCAIPEQSKHKEEAWAFLEYMLATKKGQNDMFEAIDYFPSYIPAWDDPIYEAADPYFGGQKTRTLWKNMAGGLDVPVYTTIMDTTVESQMRASIYEGIEKGFDAQKIKALIREQVATATAELRRQQIQTLRDAGVWKD